MVRVIFVHKQATSCIYRYAGSSSFP